MKNLWGLIVLIILLLVVWLQFSRNSGSSQKLPLSEMTFAQLKIYFTDLANQKGAKTAFKVLQTSTVPANTDMHLLGHVVGDVLYQQQGADGMTVCTEDFRNACSHSIVVGLFSDKGDAALSEIAKACQKAPGGLGAYIMCYHGLGHGILAYTGYDFSQTLKLCQKTGTKNYANREYPECVSGAVMEIISGGGHDRETWSRQRPKYLQIDNPLYICSANFMPEEARGRCYDYLTPYLWEAVGADVNHPQEADFKKSFELCNRIREAPYRSICMGGFGKEFVALSQERDIRRVDQMDENKLKKVVNWCDLAPDQGAVTACLDSALSSIYWGGENDVGAAIRFCSAISDASNLRNCFQNLTSQVGNYINDPKIRESFCTQIPFEFTNECQQRLIPL